MTCQCQNLCTSVGNCSMICRWPPSHQTSGCSKSSMPLRQLTTAGMQLTVFIDCFVFLPLIWSRIRVQFLLPCMHFLSPLWSQECSLLIIIEGAQWHCGLVYHLLCIMVAYHFIALLKASLKALSRIKGVSNEEFPDLLFGNSVAVDDVNTKQTLLATNWFGKASIVHDIIKEKRLLDAKYQLLV